MLSLATCLGLLLQAGEWTKVGEDAKLFATAPVRWEAQEWGLAAAAIGVTAALIPLADQSVRTWTREHQAPTSSRFVDVVRQAGNGWYTVPMLGVLWGSGELLDSPRESRAAREAVEALLFTTVVSQTVKYSTGRRRPFATDDPWDWNASRGVDGNSFGSGHAQAAWSVLTVIGLEYQEVPGIAPLAFGMATACAASRIYDQKHWSSDVFAGSLLGFVGGWAIVKWNRERALEVKPDGVALRLAF